MRLDNAAEDRFELTGARGLVTLQIFGPEGRGRESHDACIAISRREGFQHLTIGGRRGAMRFVNQDQLRRGKQLLDDGGRGVRVVPPAKQPRHAVWRGDQARRPLAHREQVLPVPLEVLSVTPPEPKELQRAHVR